MYFASKLKYYPLAWTSIHEPIVERLKEKRPIIAEERWYTLTDFGMYTEASILLLNIAGSI